MVSTLSGMLSASACLESRAQVQVYLFLHSLQMTPPISFMNYGPSIMRLPSPSLIMPTSLAIAVAVMMLSPVTILTFMPAR